MTEDTNQKNTISRRRRLIPRWLVVASASVLAAAVLAVVLVIVLRPAETATPVLVGMDERGATELLETLDLRLEVSGHRFSADYAEGIIIEQTPAPDELVSVGGVVTVVLSAGDNEFPLPDVTGMTLDEASSVLGLRGLEVAIDTIPSDAPRDTVVSTVPSPNTTVRAGDIVRVVVAVSRDSASALLPYELDGVTVLIDPGPPAGSSDVTMEIARRLRSLLEASDATVVVTRSAAESSTPESARSLAAAESSATVAIGLDVRQTGEGGLTIITQSGPADATTTRLRVALGQALQFPGYRLNPDVVAADSVLAAAGAPGVRLVLGSAADATDAAAFADPAWADTVARALYRALGDALEL